MHNLQNDFVKVSRKDFFLELLLKSLGSFDGKPNCEVSSNKISNVIKNCLWTILFLKIASIVHYLTLRIWLFFLDFLTLLAWNVE